MGSSLAMWSEYFPHGTVVGGWVYFVDVKLKPKTP